MNRQKTIHDVLGWVINCKDFNPCPVCYGCRNYDPSRLKCINHCEEQNKKFNTCDRTIHTEKALSMFIRREKIIIDKRLTNE